MRLTAGHAMGAITDESWAVLQAVQALRVLDNWTQPQSGNDCMKVMLTGGAGDLGTVLTPILKARGDTPLRLDIVPPTDSGGIYMAGSILDRDGLTRWFAGVDSVVHIAAWHGIHETTGAKDVYAFWDLNVTGTMNVFEAALRAGVTQVVYLSSTSVRHCASLYGHTKVLGEAIAQTYKTRHAMRVVILRPRGFIPHWNRAVYASFIAWLAWFWRGAVHINDVAQAVVRSLDCLATAAEVPPVALVVDGAYEYTAADLAAWDAEGPGSTFKRYYAPYEALARRYGLPPEGKPWCYDIAETQQWLGYVPRYSLRQALEELVRYGPAGPPGPAGRGAPLQG
jgi:UDP-glucose 4-epimerase